MKFFRKVIVVLSAVMIVSACCRSIHASQTKEIFPIADAYVSSANPDLNYGDEGCLYVSNNYLEEKTTFIMFSLAEICNETQIKFVKLRLYASWVFAVHNISVFYCPLNDWSESNLTWTNKPSFSDTAICSVNVNQERAWYEWNVTSVVQSACGSDKRISFVLKTNYYYNTTYADFVEFYSKDQFVFDEYRPRLVVELEGETGISLPFDMGVMLFVLGGILGVGFAIVFLKIEDKLKKLANKYPEKRGKLLSKKGWTIVYIAILFSFFIFLFLPSFGFPSWIEWLFRTILIGIIVGLGVFAMAHI